MTSPSAILVSRGWGLQLNQECRMEGCYCLKLRSDVLESLSSRAFTKTILHPEKESHANLAKAVSPSFAMTIPLSTPAMPLGEHSSAILSERRCNGARDLQHLE